MIGSINILINKAKTKGIIIGFVKLRVKATATKAKISKEAVINLLFSFCFNVSYLLLVSFVSFASCLRSFFVRPTYLRIQGRMQILRFWTEIFKNEVLQRWRGARSTQNEKCNRADGFEFLRGVKKVPKTTCKLRL